MTSEQFNAIFPDAFSPNVVKPFIHRGEWAIHDVVRYLCNEATASVQIATFSISEDSLRTLFFLVEEKKISSLHLLLDTTVKRHKLDMLLFARNISPNIAIDSVHAKITLLRFQDKRCFGIVGSANLNLNARWESGFYFSSGEVFDFFSNKFDFAFSNAMIYDN